jgi:hypothetical protein
LHIDAVEVDVKSDVLIGETAAVEVEYLTVDGESFAVVLMDAVVALESVTMEVGGD